jgi:two-component system LytT family sensor kinase
MGSYNLKIGIIVSFFISALASVPRIVRVEIPDYEAIIENTIYTFGLAFFCWILHHFFITTRFSNQIVDIPWIKSILTILLGVLFALLYHRLTSYFMRSSPLLLENLNQEKKITMLLFRGLIISGFQFFVVYYMHMLGETQWRKIENEKLKKENLQARLDSLKQQISPHFLFNTLNTLSALTKEEKVKEYTAQLSQVYRYVLQVKENDLVRAEEELDFVRAYFYILHERFEDALKMDIDVNEEFKKAFVPPLSIQMLVENALKHNTVSTAKPLHIEIYSNGKYVTIRNNYQFKQTFEIPSGHGLHNIQERYQLLANREIVIEKDEHYFSVKLPLL